MKVIKEGNKDKLKHTKVFECQYCDCVFEANSNEYWGGGARDPDYYASCPCCHSGCSEKKNYVPEPEPQRKYCSDFTRDDPNCIGCFDPTTKSCYAEYSHVTTPVKTEETTSEKGRWVPETCREAFGGDEVLWYTCGDPIATYFCSNCHNECYVDEFGHSILSKYCPFCGTEMYTEEE